MTGLLNALRLAGTLMAVLPAFAGADTAIPPDAELEARAARIGDIRIVVDDVFEARPGRNWNGLYRLANRLHATTDNETIEPQLLFNPGDLYVRRKLDESARILRSRRYFNDASIVPVAYHDDNSVDVEVRAHDVWTFSPGLSFGRSGGANRSGIELKDSNLFGWGKTVALSRESNVDRTSWVLDYDDPNVRGSWWHLGLDFADSSDGYLHAFAIDRPFYSLQTPWSFGAAVSDSSSTVARYDRGHIVDQFDTQSSRFGLSGGVQRSTRAGWVSRYLGGFRFERDLFSQAAPPLVGPLPADRVLSYPWAGIEWLEDSYLTATNLNQIGRTEDLHLGRSLRLSAGLADRAFGADRTAVMLYGTAGAGAALGPDRYLLTDLTYSGRLESGVLTDSRFGADLAFYLRHADWGVFYAALSGEFGSRLDADRQVLLGGDNGLRGYPLRYQAGSARALITVEERFYTQWRPFELFQVGGAVFFDAGRAWGSDPVAEPTGKLLKDVGVGLRFGSLRSGLGNVIHVDLALPLDRAPGIDGVQLLIGTHKSF